jgi:hypothetical protein
MSLKHSHRAALLTFIASDAQHVVPAELEAPAGAKVQLQKGGFFVR